jgi:hypothetical protein
MPVVLAFLQRDWKYIATILGLVVAVGYIYHRGESHVKAADAKVVAAQIIHNGEVDAQVKTEVAAALKDYDDLSPLPQPVPVPVLVCHGASQVLPSPAPAKGSDAAGAAVPVTTEKDSAGFDPAPAINADVVAADIEIERLQKKIDLLQALIRAYQDAGLVAK